MAIGRDGKLPWHYSSDLKFFKRTTIGNTVVMGRSTWEAIGKPLPERLNVVLSRTQRAISDANVIVMQSVAQVTELARYLRGDVHIIGGARTYEAFAPIIDEWVVTDIPIRVPDADTFMPADFLDGFTEMERLELEPGVIARRLRREIGSGV